ncbi:MAG TPA: SAM-dependent methyltransferase [Clostridiales bacterium]|nr:SAM-dependent methyltransferase [Clostridiales bacterium]
MRLGRRLQTIADKVPKVEVVADVGTDHGYIPVYLIKNNICQRVIATDIKTGPLKKAALTVKKFNMQDRIELRQGDGLQPLGHNEAQVIIIAGMGGLLMKEILDRGRDKIHYPLTVLILQPMNAQDIIRKWLIHNGFMLVDEQLAREERKFYEIMVARPGFQSPPENPVYYEIGETLIKNRDPLLRDYIKHRINICKNILRELEHASTRVDTRYMEMQGRIKRYEEVLLCLANVKA